MEGVFLPMSVAFAPKRSSRHKTPFLKECGKDSTIPKGVMWFRGSIVVVPKN